MTEYTEARSYLLKLLANPSAYSHEKLRECADILAKELEEPRYVESGTPKVIPTMKELYGLYNLNLPQPIRPILLVPAQWGNIFGEQVGARLPEVAENVEVEVGYEAEPVDDVDDYEEEEDDE